MSGPVIHVRSRDPETGCERVDVFVPFDPSDGVPVDQGDEVSGVFPIVRVQEVSENV